MCMDYRVTEGIVIEIQISLVYPGVHALSRPHQLGLRDQHRSHAISLPSLEPKQKIQSITHPPYPGFMSFVYPSESNQSVTPPQVDTKIMYPI